jgi:hypothetical protein
MSKTLNPSICPNCGYVSYDTALLLSSGYDHYSLDEQERKQVSQKPKQTDAHSPFPYQTKGPA